MDSALALEHIRSTRIITVLRGDFPADKAIAVCEVLLEAGLNIVELTYNSPDWREALPALQGAFKSDLPPTCARHWISTPISLYRPFSMQPLCQRLMRRGS